jgi:phosphoribosylformylglycinamidine synthase
MRQLALAIDGMGAACRALSVPVVSGNVSLYNETDGRAILPTPTVAVVGLVADAGDVLRAAFPAAGLSVLLLGGALGGPLGGSEYVARHTGEVKGQPPAIDLDREARLQGLVLALARSRPRLLQSAHDVSDGGLSIALGECCTAADDAAASVGARVRLPDGEALAAALFGEAPSRILVSAQPEDVPAIARRAKEAGVPCVELGTTGGARLTIEDSGRVVIDVELGALREARERCLEPIVGA